MPDSIPDFVNSTPERQAVALAEPSLSRLTLQLMRLGLQAPDLGSAMQPVLTALVERTSAVGAGYFQFRDATLAYHARATVGEMPTGPALASLLAHGLPGNLPLIEKLAEADETLYFADTRESATTEGFPELGVQGLCASPVRNREGELVGALLAHTFCPHPWDEAERVVVSSVTGLLSLLAARLHAEEREQAAHEGALRALGLSLEARDAETQGHTDRVTRLSERLGERLGLSSSELRELRWGAYLHDLGKISLPDQILLYEGPLTPEMRQRMCAHVAEGVRLAGELPFLPQTVLDVIGAHHERWDGTGYPLGLRREEIPLAARIFAICDVYDALASVRPYKQAWEKEDILNYLRAASGQHFDPSVTAALLELLSEDPPPQLQS
ncbi:HD-GYP domain-containing protein [Deinococcus sp. VB343]|uniref:HD-GYP domain-containing protein n=1 Tax=Deinococcus sp. VB343 TaxID=3385567 RepID=UPI0039C8D553